MNDSIEVVLHKIQEFIKNNNKNPHIAYVSKALFSDVSSIGVQLPDHNKEYSVIIEDGIVSEITEEKKNHAFTVSFSKPLVLRLIELASEKNYRTLMKEAQTLKIPLRYKFRFGKLFLMSSNELRKCKELFDISNVL